MLYFSSVCDVQPEASLVMVRIQSQPHFALDHIWALPLQCLHGPSPFKSHPPLERFTSRCSLPVRMTATSQRRWRAAAMMGMWPMQLQPGLIAKVSNEKR